MFKFVKKLENIFKPKAEPKDNLNKESKNKDKEGLFSKLGNFLKPKSKLENKTEVKQKAIVQPENKKEKPKKGKKYRKEKKQEKLAERRRKKEEKKQKKVSKPKEIKVTSTESRLDGNKIYKLPDNNLLFISFRDYAGEMDIAQLIAAYSRLSVEELLKRLSYKVNEPMTYSKKAKRGSSGKSGEGRFFVGTKEEIKFMRMQDNVKKSNRKRKLSHTDGNTDWQILKKSNGAIGYDSFTLKNLLVILYAITDNVTEINRADFYADAYWTLIHYMPELKEILPKGRYS